MTKSVSGRPGARPVLLAVTAACAAVFCAAAAPAGGVTPADKSWNCRASVGYATNGALRVEPLVSNGDLNGGDRALCATDDAGPAPISLAGISSTAASATTRIASELAPAFQTPASAVMVENLTIGGPVGALVTAQTVSSSASASCVNKTPQLSGESRALGASILGTPVVADGELPIVGNSTNGLPVGQVLTVKFNQQQRTATALTQHAIEVELKSGSVVLASAVAGETKVAAQGEVCSATRGPGPDPQPCPAGSTYDAPSNLCVIVRTVPGATQTIVVGAPSGGPVGGTVVPLTDLPEALRDSPCAKGKGPAFAIIGTNGPDRVTGTNKADRILTLGGKDKASAGRGNDCVDGGDGGGTFTGDQGNDIVLGGKDRDAIKGGAQKDRLIGLAGNDRITADFGGDNVDAGAGDDFVNASVSGPPARVNCGPGKDRASLNTNEVRTARGCERTRVLTVRTKR